MRPLAYIPGASDKQTLRKLLQQPSHKPPQQISDQEPFPLKQAQKNILSKQELTDLLGRLTRNTKKDYSKQQQAVNILNANKELQQKRSAGDKVENRLIAKGKEREQKINELAEHLQKEQKEKYHRDIPQISEKGRSKQQKTIDRRLTQLLSQKQVKQEQLNAKYQPSFQPVTDPHSEFINDIENLGDLYNRMTSKQAQADKRRQMILKKITEQQLQELTFQPKINEKSKQIAESLPQKTISCKPSLSSYHSQVEIYPFAPTINKNTDRYLSSRRKEQDCFRRLYKQAKELTVKKQQEFDKISRADSFQPTINKKSIEMAKQLKQKQVRAQSVVAKTQKSEMEDLQQIRIGRESSHPRERSYSLKNSSVIKRPWLQSDEPSMLGGLGVYVSRKCFIR